MNTFIDDLSQLATSRFIRKEDIGDQTTVTIRNFEKTNVAPPDQPAEMKGVVWFQELDKPLVLNTTNRQELQAAFGHKAADCIGKQVALYVDESIVFAGKRVGGIRLKALTTKPRASTAQVNEKLNEASS